MNRRTQALCRAALLVACFVPIGVVQGDVRQTVVSPPLIVNQLYYFNGILQSVGGTGSIDLDGNGTPDLIFQNGVIPQVGTNAGVLSYVTPGSGVLVVQKNLPFGDVGLANLPAGTLIGPGNSLYTSGNSVVVNTRGDLNGFEEIRSPSWILNQTAYVGFSITDQGQTRYGWISMQFGTKQRPTQQQIMTGYSSNAPWGFEIDSFALETSPDTPVAAGVVPEPGAIAILSLAAAGLLVRTRRVRHQHIA